MIHWASEGRVGVAVCSHLPFKSTVPRTPRGSTLGYKVRCSMLYNEFSFDVPEIPQVSLLPFLFWKTAALFNIFFHRPCFCVIAILLIIHYFANACRHVRSKQMYSQWSMPTLASFLSSPIPTRMGWQGSTEIASQRKAKWKVTQPQNTSNMNLS